MTSAMTSITPEALSRLLGYLDHKPPGDDERENARIAMSVRCFNTLVGEDFLVASLVTYLESHGNLVEISHQNLSSIDATVRERESGHRHCGQADAWLRVTPKSGGAPIIYLVEAKNWSSRSLGGRYIPGPVDEVIPVSDLARRWSDQYGWYFEQPPERGYQLQKIFYAYCPPVGWDLADPARLLAVWDPVRAADAADSYADATVAARSDGTACFWTTHVSRPTANDPQAIRRLQVFSLSLYLRGLIASNQSLTISVDRIREKMSLIQEFFGEIPDLLGVSLTDDRSILLVSISSSWVSDHNRLPEMLWPCARGWWRCSPERTYAIRHLVAVDENHVVGIWAVTGAKRGHELIINGRGSGTGVVFDTMAAHGMVTIMTSQGKPIRVGMALPAELALCASFRYA